MTIISQQVLEGLPEFNEASIRYHIIDPVVRRLGYNDRKGVFFKLEEKLEYPYSHIGHRNKDKDVPLGFPDYRAGLDGRRGSFIIEAKSASVKISEKDIEQAHSYAAHAQVGANYFVLCDGRVFAVYETLSGTDHVPIVSIPVSEIDHRFHEIENILSPENLEKHCHVSYDLGLKLCDGLPSSVDIKSGQYEMDDWTYRIFINGNECTEALKNSVPQLSEADRQIELLRTDFTLRVESGQAKRNTEGRIIAEVSFSGATKNNHAAMKLLGLDQMKFATDDKFLSLNPEEPTVFESTTDFSVDKGTMLPPMFGDAIPMELDVKGDIFITTRMYKKDGELIGKYAAISDYSADLPAGAGKMKFEMDYIGRFSLNLAT